MPSIPLLRMAQLLSYQLDHASLPLRSCVLCPPQAEVEMEEFLKEEHTFLEYEKQVYKYQELVSELQYSVQKV